MLFAAVKRSLQKNSLPRTGFRGCLPDVSVRTAIPLLMVLMILSFSGCSRSWLVYRGEGGAGITGATVRPPLGVKWKLLLQARDNKRESFNPPAVWGSFLYFGSADGNLYALDIRTGYMKWVFRTGGAINSVPTADKNSVFIGSSDGNVYCLDRETGHLQWTFGTNAAVNSTIVLRDNKVYAISDVDAVYCLERFTGALLWSAPNTVWQHNSFQIHENVLYFAPGPPERAYSLTGFDLETQSYLWFVETELDNYFWYSFPAVKGDDLYYAAAGLAEGEWDLAFYCVDRMTGVLKWRQFDYGLLAPGTDGQELLGDNLEQLDYMAPAIYRNRVYFAAGDQVLRVYNRHTGHLISGLTFSQNLSGAPLVGGNRIFLGLRESDDGSLPGQIVCLNAGTGKELWRMEIEGSLLSAPVISGKWLIFGTDRNLFYVLEEVF